MLSLNKTENQVIIRQWPVLLYAVSLIFVVPPVLIGLMTAILKAEVENGLMSISLALGFGWVLFEFVARREEIQIDLAEQQLLRIERGLFREKKQYVNLKFIDEMVLEKRYDRGRPSFHILLKGENESYLMNFPSMIYLDHGKTARLLSEQLGIPLTSVEVHPKIWK